MRKKIILTPEQESFVRANSELMTDREIGEHFGISPAAIFRWRKDNGIRKSDEFIARWAKAHMSEKFLEHSFAGGHVPKNKGLTWDEYLSPEMQARSRQTCFKPGSIPVNHREIGETSVRTDSGGHQYRYIKIKDRQGVSNMVLLHRYVWEKANGEIPEGMVLTFKDGNSLNCSLENLELISMEDRMRQNTIMRYPEELRKTIRLVNKASKLINKHERNKLGGSERAHVRSHRKARGRQ